MNSTPARVKLAVYGVRADWRYGSSPIGRYDLTDRAGGLDRVLS
ncbi:MAG TPA: hypothetical protein VLT34_16495 [Arthrobacter sp.]|nr:hypothetical protein [Arthrobacter sp.]